MDGERFEQLVARAVEALPEEFREKLENVDVVVEDLPTQGQLRQSALAATLDEEGKSLGAFWQTLGIVSKVDIYW